MRTLIRAALASMIALVVLVGPVSAATTTALTVAQATSSGTITGTVTGDGGNPVASATVILDGPQRQTTTTDASGNFSVSTVPGVYSITVTKAGFQTGTSDVTLAPSTSVTTNVTLTAASLSNLNVIGRTSSASANGNTAKFNVTGTPTQSLSQTQLVIRNTPDLTSVLQELPGVTIPHATSNPNQSFIIHGLRYETKTEIDGHPVSSGTGGTFLTNYTPAAVFGGVTVASGGGLIGPESGSSGVGIVSLNTPDFSSKNQAYVQGGLDSYGGSFVSLLADINVGDKLQFVLGRDFTGYRGPTFGTNQADYTGATPAFGTGAPANLSNGVIQYIADFSDTYSLNGELAKMRYKFSDSTSFTAEFLGLQGGFNPQGGAYGQYVGMLTVPQCINSNKAGNGLACTPYSEYNSPAAQGLVGQTIPAYAFYPGSFVAQNQPNFNAELKTTIGNDTLLFRPYTASIRRLIDGTQESNIPGDNGGGWALVTSNAQCQSNYVAASSKNGTPAYGPCFAGGQTPIAAYIGASNPATVSFATTSTAPNCAVAPYCYTTSTGLNNSGLTGFGSPYTTLEIDKLAGYTFSLIHPFGANVFNLSFDHYYDDAIDYINDASPLVAGCSFVLGSGVPNTYPGGPNNGPANPASQTTCPLPTLRPSPISVPETFSSVSSLGAAATFQLSSKLTLDGGLYFTHYLINAQALNNTAYNTYLGSLSPAQSSLAGGFPVQLVGVQNTASHMDPRFALTFRPERDWSIRFNAGSSLSIPYAGLVSGFTTYQQGSTSITQQTPNAALLPEEVVTMDLGTSYRTPDGAVLSADIYNTVVHNPWINPKVQICSTQPGCAVVFPGLEQTSLGYTSITVNGAQQYAQGIDFSLANEPRVGFGYRVNSSLERLYYLGTSPAYLPGPPPNPPAGNIGAPQVYFNGNQFVSTGSGNTSVPYMKGYAEVQYAGANQSLFRIGADYEGNNNEYNAPAFFIFDAGMRLNTGFHDVLFGISVENLFNTTFNSLLGRGVEYAGLEPVAATAAPGGYAYSTGTYNTSLVSPGPITFRFTLTKQF